MSFVTISAKTGTTEYWSLMDEDTHDTVATVVVNTITSLQSPAMLKLGVNAITNFVSVLGLVLDAAKKYPKLVLKTSNDEDAVSAAIALSNLAASTDATAVEAWTTLDFAVVAQFASSTDRPTSTRFTGASLAGIKKIVNAQSVVLTIKKKKA